MIKVDYVNEVSKIADITKVQAEVAVDAVSTPCACPCSGATGSNCALRGIPGQTREARIGPTPDGQGSPDPSGRTSGQAWQGPPEYRVIRPHGPFSYRFRDPVPHRSSRRSADLCTTVPAPYRQPTRLAVLLLFALTLLTTTLVGASHFAALPGFTQADLPVSDLQLYARGLWYSGPILAILARTSSGTTIACRYYEVDASATYFLPMPFVLRGTLGAFIRSVNRFGAARTLRHRYRGPSPASCGHPRPAHRHVMSASSQVPSEVYRRRVRAWGAALFQAAGLAHLRAVADGYTMNCIQWPSPRGSGLLATARTSFPWPTGRRALSYAVLRAQEHHRQISWSSADRLSFVSSRGACGPF